MGVVPLTLEVGVVFCFSAFLLHRYGDYKTQHVLVTIACFVAWYFSLMIIFVLPLDVSSTYYRQCLKDNAISEFTTLSVINNETTTETSFETSSLPLLSQNLRTLSVSNCKKPWSWVPETVLPVLWRVIYWTSQFLTWILLPLMQSYSNTGEFTILKKLKSSVFENLIYYGTYLLIFGICLVYVAIKPGLNVNGTQLKIIGITASNTWGLFLLVLLLGYGLVDIPRSCWNASKYGYMLSHAHFKLAKLSTEKTEAEEALEDLLDEIKRTDKSIRYSSPFRKYFDIILDKCPESVSHTIRNEQRNDGDNSIISDIITEKALAKLHKKLITATQDVQRTHCQWNETLDKAFDLEDIQANENNSNKRFVRFSATEVKPSIFNRFSSPMIEWYWKCRIQPIFLKVLTICLCLLSFMVVWSECLFFIKKPVLSFFAIFVQIAAKNSSHFYVELSSCLTIMFLCFCAYSTLFKVRIFNYYYLVRNHQTNANSLIFAGMMLCRLTPPMCLNFLGLIHLDTHITKQNQREETAYTQIMGHMDVIPFISDGFNIYFPILIVLLCVATYFNLCGKALHCCGFEQFIEDDVMIQEMVDEGKDLLRREKRRMQRKEEWNTRKKEWNDRFTDSSKEDSYDWKDRLEAKRKIHNDKSELLAEADPIDYNNYQLEDPTSSFSNPDGGSSTLGGYQSSTNYSRFKGPPRGIFDDV